MATLDIIAEIDAEISRLQKVKKLLSSPSNSGRNGLTANRSTAEKNANRRKRRLSPEARKRIADAQRKRWATQRKTAAKTA